MTVAPLRIVPRHVAACQHSHVHHERWFVATWKRDAPPGSMQTRIPYSCNSWRCEVCRRHEAAVTFARIKEAVERRDAAGELEADPTGWCFVVLTFDRDGYYGGRKWLDVNEAYAQIGKMTRALLERIGREWGSETRIERRTYKSKKTGKTRTVEREVRTVGNRWYSVVEAHRSGWPHANLVVWCPELAEYLRREREERLDDPEVADAVELARDAWARKEPVPEAVRELARKATLVGGRFGDIVRESGWGRQSTAEVARNLEAVISYGVGLVGLHDSSIGELAKITQLPMNAVERFKRLRTGKGFLPPRRSNPEVTGCMMRRRRSLEYGDWELERINAPTDKWQREQVAAYRRDGVDISDDEEQEMCARYLARQNEHIEIAARAELALIAEEEDLLAKHGALPAMPPVRLVVGGQLEGHKATSERRAAMARRELDLAG